MGDNVFLEPDPWASSSNWGSPVKPLNYKTAIGNSSIPLQYRNYWDVFQANNVLLFPEEESYSDIFHVPQDVMKEFFTLIESSSNQPLRQIQFFVLLALVACYQLGVPSTLEQIFKQRNVLPILQRFNPELFNRSSDNETPLFPNNSPPASTTALNLSSNIVPSINESKILEQEDDDVSNKSLPHAQQSIIRSFPDIQKQPKGFFSYPSSTVSSIAPSTLEAGNLHSQQPPKFSVDSSVDDNAITPRKPFSKIPNRLSPSTQPLLSNSRHSSFRLASSSTSFPASLEMNVDIDLEPSGYFFYRHNNYIISDSSNTREVLRRYSDFFWLHSYLMKKYPFRRVPLIPLKKFHFAKRNASTQNSFLEHRRQGLSDFVNDLSHHPIFSNDEVVRVFFTEPNVFKNWRRENQKRIDQEIEQFLVVPQSQVPDASETVKERLLKLNMSTTTAINNQLNIFRIFEKMIFTLQHFHEDFLRLQNSFNCLLDSGLYHQVFTSTFAQNESKIMSMASGHFYNIDSLLHQQNDAVKHTFLLGLSKEIKILISLRLLIERISEVFSTDLTKVRHTISNDENLLRETANSDESGRNRTFLNRSSKKRAENSLKSKKELYLKNLNQRYQIAHELEQELSYLQDYVFSLGNPYVEYCKQHVKLEEESLKIWHTLESDFSRLET
ncbi:Sorting nexin mvp1 [Schizosaccharomyces pombe]